MLFDFHFSVFSFCFSSDNQVHDNHNSLLHLPLVPVNDRLVLTREFPHARNTTVALTELHSATFNRETTKHKMTFSNSVSVYANFVFGLDGEFKMNKNYFFKFNHKFYDSFFK